LIEDRYNKERKYGLGIDFILNVGKEREKRDDDFFVLIIGQRNTGKSRLMLHMLEKYMGERSSIDYVGLRKGDFAKALFNVSKIKLPRMCVNDEGNLSSKEVMSRFNRAVMDTYYAIRGMNIFHVWCNPSLDGIDKRFIKEIVNGVIFTYTKYKKIRFYYYFTKKNILDILIKYGNLELKTIKKIAKKTSHHRGWFHDYDGFLLDDYKRKKDKRMKEKVDKFHEDWGSEEDTLKKTDMMKILKVSRSYFLKYEKILKDKGMLDDIITTASGRELFLPQHIDLFKTEMQNENT